MRVAKRLAKPVQNVSKSKASGRVPPVAGGVPAGGLPPPTPKQNASVEGNGTGATSQPKGPARSFEIPTQLEAKHLNFYKVTTPPNKTQLEFASGFFNKHKPTLLASFPEFRLFPDTSTPEVCFLGRSNVGKSSLLNALLRGRRSEVTAHVSKRAGRTTTMNAFAVGPSVVGLKTHGVNRAGQVVRWEGAPRRWAGKGGLVLVDLQGYGANSRDEWGTEIMKLLTRRRQLRRAFVLIDAAVGLRGNDVDLLALLRQHGVPHQIVLTKADKVLLTQGARLPSPAEDLDRQVERIKRMQDDMWRLFNDGSRWQSAGQTPLCDILVTIAEKNMPATWRLGIDPLRFAILQAAGLDCDRHGKRTSAAALNMDGVSPA